MRSAGTRLRCLARNYTDGRNATILSITRDDGLNIGGGNCVGSGTFTAYVSSTNGYSFKLLAEAGVEADITNITTIQITDDTNLPRINYEGFSYQDALGSELVVNGTFDTDSNWNNAAHWSIANGVATSTGTGRMFQSIPFLETNVGTKVKVSFDITERTSGGVQINCYGAVSQVYTDVGTHTFIGTTTNSLNLYINNAGQGNLVGSIDNVSVKEYLGQEVVPDSGCGHWLWEPQSTNLFDYSEDFSDSFWTKASATITSNSIISPDGTQDASTLVSTVGTTNQFIKASFAVISGNDYTISTFAKKKDFDYIQIRFQGRGAPFNAGGVWFNINNGTLGTQDTGYTGTITDYGNGWYRCTATATATSSAIATTRIQLADSDGSNNVVGNGTDGTYIWGAQAEEQSYSTSYIPTEGSTVTRNQDICNNGGSLASINSSEGVLYFEGSTLVNGGEHRIISLSDGTNDNLIYIRFDSTASRFRGFARGSSGSYNIITANSINQTNNNKVALVWDATNFKIWINGTERDSTALTTNLPVAMNTFAFTSPSASNNFFGKTKALVVYKEALSDSELQELTTI